MENKMRHYSYEEIRDCSIYIVENCLNNKEFLDAPYKKLIIEQLGVFENLLLEAIEPIKGRDQGIYIIVCTDMIWQVIRDLLHVSSKDNFLKPHNAPQMFQDIVEKANTIFDLHSFIRHPTENNLQKYGWIMQRIWDNSQRELVRNIAQIVYKIVMDINLTIKLEKYSNSRCNLTNTN